MTPPEIPEGIPIPGRCPECDHEWRRGYTFSEPSEVRMICVNNHRLRCFLSEDQISAFDLANKGDELLRREIWIVGDDRPAPLGGMRPRDCVEGTPIKVSGEDYLVVKVEAERVWIQKM
jgi:hypothetical protein